MLAAAILAWWWAQAEPAPVEAAPGAAAVQLAPAPTPPSPLDNLVGVYGGWGRRLGSEATAVGPANGISVGGGYQRRYFATPEGSELGVGLDFFYDKFETDVTGSSPAASGQRVLSQTSFAATQTFAWRWRRLRPFAQLGAGFTIAYFSTPELAFRPGSFDAVQPLGRGAIGLDVSITDLIAVSARAGYTHLFTRPTYTPDNTSYSFLGDLLDVDLGVSLGF